MGKMCLAATLAALLHVALAPRASAQSGPAVIVVDFSNPGLSPSHWTLTLRPDGSGHFRSERGKAPTGGPQELNAVSVDRDIQVSKAFAGRIFDTARRHNWFNEECESRMKVAFQGWKKLAYTGPEGQGACTYNYSKNKEIGLVGDAFIAVAQTLLEGSRLEMLLLHDRLGLDSETEYLVEAMRDGRAQQIGAIREILERLAGDDNVMDRVRKRALFLLARADT